ncbi:MAG: hypothetical protein MK226_10040 [Saprospiraceae bacterium]|nr:hypothetical protein [Saprospiraceae bacterium]
MEEILWEGKPQVKPNIWGFRNEKLGLDITNASLGGVPPSMFTAFVFGLFGLSLGTMLLNSISIVLSSIYFLGLSSFMVYWFFIREIKYYQMVKNTIYYITKNDIQIRQRFLGKERITSIGLDQIKQLYLIRFNDKQSESGTINLYTKSKMNAYDLTEKERTHLPKLEHIADFYEVMSLLKKLMAKKENAKATIQE